MCYKKVTSGLWSNNSNLLKRLFSSFELTSLTLPRWGLYCYIFLLMIFVKVKPSLTLNCLGWVAWGRWVSPIGPLQDCPPPQHTSRIAHKDSHLLPHFCLFIMCSGTCSASKTLVKGGWEVIEVDNGPQYGPTHVVNVTGWKCPYETGFVWSDTGESKLRARIEG